MRHCSPLRGVACRNAQKQARSQPLIARRTFWHRMVKSFTLDTARNEDAFLITDFAHRGRRGLCGCSGLRHKLLPRRSTPARYAARPMPLPRSYIRCMTTAPSRRPTRSADDERTGASRGMSLRWPAGIHPSLPDPRAVLARIHRTISFRGNPWPPAVFDKGPLFAQFQHRVETAGAGCFSDTACDPRDCCWSEGGVGQSTGGRPWCGSPKN